MIRYVFIGDQIMLSGGTGQAPARDFSFWDTVRDKFVSFDGNYMFSSLDDFDEWTLSAKEDAFVQRCRSLIPTDPADPHCPYPVDPDDE